MNKENNALNAYLNEIGSKKLLSDKEEAEFGTTNTEWRRESTQ